MALCHLPCFGEHQCPQGEVSLLLPMHSWHDPRYQLSPHAAQDTPSWVNVAGSTLTSGSASHRGSISTQKGQSNSWHIPFLPPPFPLIPQPALARQGAQVPQKTSMRKTEGQTSTAVPGAPVGADTRSGNLPCPRGRQGLSSMPRGLA